MLERISVEKVYQLPLKNLIGKASEMHRENFSENHVQLSALLSIKTGGCPENCGYCPQSAHYKSGVQRQALMDLQSVKDAASTAKACGATRFCMGAAWREIKEGPEFDRVLEMVREVRALGLEVCCTLGMLNSSQALKLKDAGLHAYNHNIDSSRNFYSKVISTRQYDDRLRTLQTVREAGITVCTGGIIGMGETHEDRIDFIHQLATLTPHPESVTVNALIPIKGTPLENQPVVPAVDLARVIATLRCLMPKSMIRLSAGRKSMSEEGQFLCFLSGANSIFLGETLLTSANPSVETDKKFLNNVGMSSHAL